MVEAIPSTCVQNDVKLPPWKSLWEKFWELQMVLRRGYLIVWLQHSRVRFPVEWGWLLAIFITPLNSQLMAFAPATLSSPHSHFHFCSWWPRVSSRNISLSSEPHSQCISSPAAPERENSRWWTTWLSPNSPPFQAHISRWQGQAFVCSDCSCLWGVVKLCLGINAKITVHREAFYDSIFFAFNTSQALGEQPEVMPWRARLEAAVSTPHWALSSQMRGLYSWGGGGCLWKGQCSHDCLLTHHALWRRRGWMHCQGTGKELAVDGPGLCFWSRDLQLWDCFQLFMFLWLFFWLRWRKS